MPIPFTSSPERTLGVEMEVQIIDSKSKDLATGSLKIFEKLGGEQQHIKPELMQAMIEINTGVCRTVKEVRRDLEQHISTLESIGRELGYEFAASGSHPFARYSDRIPYPADRYQYLIDRNRWIARRLMIFGLHVHVGMRDANHAMAMNNAMLHYLPHLLGLSASSPFWQGNETGLASSRVTIFESLPTGGHPCTFRTWSEFEKFYDSMIRSKSISSIKDIWWDIRPHPDYGTVEIRVCDGLPSLHEIVGLVALIQSLVEWFDERYKQGEGFAPPPYWILRENKWRASRWGKEAAVILDESGRTALLKDEVRALIPQLAPFASRLGCAEELGELGRTMELGLSYERQQQVYEQEGTFLGVVESVVEEFRSREPLFRRKNGREDANRNYR